MSPSWTSTRPSTSSALTLPEGVKPIIRGRDFTICSIVAPTSVIEEQQRCRRGCRRARAVEAAPAEGAAPAAGAAPVPPVPRLLPVPRPRWRQGARRRSGEEVSRARAEASPSWTRRCSSRGWAIPARNMRATGTMPASSSPTRFTPHYRFGPWKAKFDGLLSEGTLARAQDLSAQAPDLHERQRRQRRARPCASSSCRWRRWW